MSVCTGKYVSYVREYVSIYDCMYVSSIIQAEVCIHVYLLGRVRRVLNAQRSVIYVLTSAQAD